MKSKIGVLRKSVSFLLFFVIILTSFAFISCNENETQIAAKPLFRDPVYDGAADPVVIWNVPEQRWFMFYTNRRANVAGLDGVAWVHGTRIGIAESVDSGATWTYRDTCDIAYRLTSDYTHWAPEVIAHDGLYHMYLTYVPGVFTDWNHPRNMIHLTSKNLINWNYESTLNLACDKVIDACVFPMPDGTWRMWYNNERDRKSIYFADSPDLYHWEDQGKAVGDQGGEGPKVFQWKGKFWVITDVWQGLAVYSSDDLANWMRIPGNLLETPGTGPDDQVKGGHPDVVVQGEKAYLFYFTHPGRIDSIPETNCAAVQFRWLNWLTKMVKSLVTGINRLTLVYRDRINCSTNKQFILRLTEGAEDAD